MSKEEFNSIGFDVKLATEQKLTDSIFPPMKMDKKFEELIQESHKKALCQMAGIRYEPPYKRVDYCDFTHEEEEDSEPDDPMDYPIRLSVILVMLHGGFGPSLPKVTDLESFYNTYRTTEKLIKINLESNEVETIGVF